MRDAAEEAAAAFVMIQIMARGRIVEEGSQHFLLAGPDRFLLIEPGESAPPLPASSGELSVVGSIDDSERPVKVKLVKMTPAEAP